MIGFITVAVTKLHVSRSQQNHTTLQHEQPSSGELNGLRDVSLQPAVTFSFVIGSMRCFDYCILRAFVKKKYLYNAFSMAYYYFNK
jgi:hypothetical protein